MVDVLQGAQAISGKPAKIGLFWKKLELPLKNVFLGNDWFSWKMSSNFYNKKIIYFSVPRFGADLEAFAENF